MATRIGLEPTTPSVTGWCSNQLSYRAILEQLLLLRYGAADEARTRYLHLAEYDDPAFFARMGEIGKRVGFSWGGDWGSFPDRPHFQWDAGGVYTSAMIRAKRYPPPMPRYEEEEMTQQQFDAMMENYLTRLAQQTPASWSAEARAWAEKNGLIAGDEAGNKQYRSFLTREQMAVLMQRYDAMQRGK